MYQKRKHGGNIRETRTDNCISALISIFVFQLLPSVVSPALAESPAPPTNQIIGISDSVFNNLEEADCRFCHENPDNPSDDTYLPNRHHNLVNTPIQAGKCAFSLNICFSDSECDTNIEEACIGGTAAPITDSDNDGYNDSSYQCLNCHVEETNNGTIQLLVYRDCLLCHNQTPGEASVHHLSATAQGVNSPLGDPNIGDCSPCHGTVIDDIGDGHFIPDYQPSARTPTSTGGDAFPLNSRGNGAGACNYCHDSDMLAASDPNKAIYTNQETHHGTGLASDSGKCVWCHDFTLSVQEQMRVCEGCHGPDSLHAIQTDSDNDGVITPGVELPFFGHVGEPDDCWGCHGFGLSAAAGTGPVVPNLALASRRLVTAGVDTSIDLVGNSLTNISEGAELTSYVTLSAEDGSSIALVPDTVSESVVTVTIPGATTPGNYRLRAVKETEKSNPIAITVVPPVVISGSNCNKKKQLLSVTGSGFGDKPVGTDDYINIELDAQTLETISWSDNQIKASSSTCSNYSLIIVNAIQGTATYENNSSGGSGNPPKPCNGKKCQ